MQTTTLAPARWDSTWVGATPLAQAHLVCEVEHALLRIPDCHLQIESQAHDITLPMSSTMAKSWHCFLEGHLKRHQPFQP